MSLSQLGLQWLTNFEHIITYMSFWCPSLDPHANHVPVKYRCPLKIIILIRPTYFIGNPKMVITRFWGTSKNGASFPRWISWAHKEANMQLPAPISKKEQTLRFTYGWLIIGCIYPIHVDVPTIIEWTIVVGWIRTQVLGRSPTLVLFQS